ncbi:MAG: DUF3696 domain-containing protein [Dolichospermum sp. DET50]|nr:DUF3696 domain-containing protein [Dolichospermum sp. DET66]MBS3034150.1 DUF3696 domain-containing protein [Dolichospermum sp. DET67]MBS3039353.1 DUF3696 domain-containing protein [Dolichospermum sp. DET50]QSX66577.1 MAG: DUF3696 domain-containing protein [Dolichospermum sp. DET69]
MLTQIKLENFKCFKERTSFSLGQLTLLTGINGCGKSTLLQSLLLMRQSIDHNENTDQILLNGSCVSLNSFNDVRNINNSRNEDIILQYCYNKLVEIYDTSNPSKYTKFNISGDAKYFLSENSEDDMVGKIQKIQFYDKLGLNFLQDEHINKSDLYKIISVYEPRLSNFLSKFIVHYNINIIDKNNNTNSYSGGTLINNLIPEQHYFMVDNIDNIYQKIASEWLHKSLNFSHIHYISADRLGPQEYYLKSTINKFPNVGAKGEFTVNLLYKKRDDLVNEKLCLGEDAKTLATQTEEWLNEIFNGAKVEVPSSQSNILELLFNTSASKDRFRPANVGFGYSYILPIVVSGLIAKEGEILIVENPEAHLHPKAQSRLAKFLAKVSSCGVQVFIESHSDHILNALRIAVLDDIITHEDLSILYFQQNPEQPVVKIPVQPNGGIEEWPEGFFDQMDKDFARLFGM